jgi:hypothetical protein
VECIGLESRHEDTNKLTEDPCLFFKKGQHSDHSIWISYVDDLLTVGRPMTVKRAKETMKRQFDCDEVSKLEEFLHNCVDVQSVLLQSFQDKFELKPDKVKLPSTGGSMLTYKQEGARFLKREKQKKFRSGVGKLLHLAKWSRPEIKNAVKELSRGMTKATEEAFDSMLRVMKYCVDTPNKGLILAPRGTWSGLDDKELIIKGMSDTTYASDLDTRKVTFLNEAPVII